MTAVPAARLMMHKCHGPSYTKPKAYEHCCRLRIFTPTNVGVTPLEPPNPSLY